MGFARKLGFCLKPTGPCGKLFPVKSDLTEAPIIFMFFVMKFWLFSIKKQRLQVYENMYNNVSFKSNAIVIQRL